MEDDQHSDTIGDLTLADTTLCDILLRILNVVRYPKKTKARWEPTTNQAADLLQEKRDADPDLFPPEFDSWLSRVKDAAHQRNAIVHAAAENRCVACGQVARFKHRGKAVDRSAHRVATLTERFDELTREGVKLVDCR